MTTVATALPYAAGSAYRGFTLQDVRLVFGVEARAAYDLLLNCYLKEEHHDRLRRHLLRYCELPSLLVFAWAGLRELTQPACEA